MLKHIHDKEYFAAFCVSVPMVYLNPNLTEHDENGSKTTSSCIHDAASQS